MNKIIVFSLEGINSNTEVNFFDGLGFHLPNNNLKCFAIGKHSSEAKAINALKLAIRKMESFFKEEKIDKIVFLFVADFDKKIAIDSINNTAKWIHAFIEEKQLIFFPNQKVITIKEVFGDVGHSIETSLNRTGIKLRTKNSKYESNKNLFNDAIENSIWFVKGNFNIDEAINSLKKINSSYYKLFQLIKEYS